MDGVQREKIISTETGIEGLLSMAYWKVFIINWKTGCRKMRPKNWSGRETHGSRSFIAKEIPRRTRTTSRYSRTCQDAYNSGISQGKKLIIHKGVRKSGNGEVKYLN